MHVRDAELGSRYRCTIYSLTYQLPPLRGVFQGLIAGSSRGTFDNVSIVVAEVRQD